MSQFQINNQQNTNYTLISNPFIDDFLADANDAQIKVYLYLLRHQNNAKECSISAMADFFNYSEKDVIRALTYWERKKVLQLTYNNENELIGICLCCFDSAETPQVSVSSQTVDAPTVKTVAYLSNTSTYVKPEYTLDQLAEVCHVSKYHLAHAFTEEYGISPINYLISKRIAEAEHLLKTTDFSLSLISNTTGFSSSSYFAQIFKKQKGMSPTEFRKLGKQGLR